MKKHTSNKSQRQLVDAKNLVRGTLNHSNQYLEQRNHVGRPRSSKTDLIYQGIASLDDKTRRQFLKWLNGYPGSVIDLIPNKIEDWGAVQLPRIKVAIDLSTRIRVSAHLVSRFLDKLEIFGELSSAAEFSLLSGDQKGYFEAISEVEDLFGLSLWLLEARIVGLQSFEGLDSQKSFARTISTEFRGSLPGVISYYCSERNENETLLSRYRARTRFRLDGWKVEENTKRIFAILLHAYDLSDFNGQDHSFLLAALTEVSLIDAYSALCSAAEFQILAAGNDTERTRVRKELEKSLACVPCANRRIKRLLSFLGSKDAGDQLKDDHRAQVGRNLVRNAIGSNISNQNKLELDESDAPLASYVTEIFRCVICREDGFFNQLEQGTKLVTTLSSFSISKILWALLVSDCRYRKSLRGSWSLPFALEKALPEGKPNQGQTMVAGETTSAAPSVDHVVLNLEAAIRRKISKEDLTEARKLLLSTNILSVDQRRRLRPLLVWVAFWLDDFSLALRQAALVCAADSDVAKLLPLSRLADEVKDEIPNNISSLAAAVVLHAQMALTSDQTLFQPLQFAFEATLSEIEVTKPSGINGEALADDEQRELLIYFLREIATPDVMDVCFWVFKSSRETFQERIDVCSLLIGFDPDREKFYSQEIREIATGLSVEEGVEQVDRSRIFVNIDKLHAWANKELREGLNRYKALAPLESTNTLSAGVAKILKDLISDESSGLAIFYPEDEVSTIIIDLFSSVTEQYFNNSEFGLDAYLSMRVRHGSFAGHLRGPFEESGLLGIKDKSTGRYKVNSEIKLADGTSCEISDRARRCIAEFSERFDHIVEEVVKNRLQICDENHKDGFFKMQVASFAIFYLRSRLDQSVTVDEFIQSALEMLHANLTGCLKVAKEYLLGQFQSEMECAIDALGVEASKSLPHHEVNLVDERIAAALPSWHATLKRVSGWFSPDSVANDQSSRTMDQMVDIAIQATRNARRHFTPNIFREIRETGPQSSAHMLDISDILFTALDNIYVHSGAGDSPYVLIRITGEQIPSSKQRRVTFYVENEIGCDVACAATERKLQRLRESLESGNYREKIKKEGGTGISKLKKLISEDQRQSLSFGIEEDSKFWIRVSMIFAPVLVI